MDGKRKRESVEEENPNLFFLLTETWLEHHKKISYHTGHVIDSRTSNPSTIVYRFQTHTNIEKSSFH